jgi:phytol kinase
LTKTPCPKPKLVVFDVEGVLIPRNRLFFEVGRSLGLLPLLKVLLFGFLYEIGAMRLTSALKHLFGVTRGAKPEIFTQSLNKQPLMPNAQETFAALKAEGCKIALISSGVPTFLVEKLAKTLGADYAVGIELGVSGGVLTGEIWGDVIQRDGKVLVLREIAKSEGLASLRECVVVADDRNNASMFVKETRKVGFNPDFLIRIKADAVINGKLLKILPIVRGETKKRSLPSKQDLLREGIHGSGFFVPIVASFISVPLAASLIAIVVGVYIVSELLRLRNKNLPIISTITRCAASGAELCEFTLSPVYFAVGILITLLLFPAPASSAAIAAFALGDSTASLAGGLLSKKPLPFNAAKTIEGTLTGFVFATLAAMVFVAPWLALVAGAVAMTIEYLPLPVNDNLMIPFGTGLALMLLIH